MVFATKQHWSLHGAQLGPIALSGLLEEVHGGLHLELRLRLTRQISLSCAWCLLFRNSLRLLLEITNRDGGHLVLVL